jgi:uncharacterized protein YkwD
VIGAVAERQMTRPVLRAVLLATLAVSACDKASPTAPTPSPQPVTRVVSLTGSLAFGAVEVGKTAESTLTIGNNGTGTLSVSGIAVPDGYTANWTNGTIAPGSSQQVVVRFAPAAARSYDGALTVNGDHTAGTNTAPVSGSGRAPALASLAGTVTDSAAAALGDVTIEIRDGPDARTWTRTGADGRFALTGLQPGSVTVRASRSGYADVEQRVALAAGSLASVTFSLEKNSAPPQTPAPEPPTSPPTPPPSPPPPPPTFTAYDDEILQLINAHRARIGKAALQKTQVIWEQANAHSRNMASGTVPFGHDGFSDRVAAIRAALGGSGSAAENVAMGYSSAAAVVNGWLSSSGHRANIEGNYTRTGLSAVRSGSGTWYYTQIFYY